MHTFNVTEHRSGELVAALTPIRATRTSCFLPSSSIIMPLPLGDGGGIMLSGCPCTRPSGVLISVRTCVWTFVGVLSNYRCSQQTKWLGQGRIKVKCINFMQRSWLHVHGQELKAHVLAIYQLVHLSVSLSEGTVSCAVTSDSI